MVTKLTTAKHQLQEEVTFFFVVKTFFMKNFVKIGVHIIHGCVLYTGKYGNTKFLSLICKEKCRGKRGELAIRSWELKG